MCIALKADTNRSCHTHSATAKQQLELPPVAPNSIPGDTDEFTSIVLENLYAALEVGCGGAV